MSRVLVTGGSGFVGRLVLERWEDGVAWPRGVDLGDPDQVERALSGLLEGGFDRVLHLAAQASPSLSLEEPVLTWRVNLMGTVHLLECLHRKGWKGRFLLVSSGAVYGERTGSITEQTPPDINSPYVASKLAAETAVLEWGRRTGSETLVVRPFNHSGPGQSSHYFLPSMAQQIVALPSEGGVIEVGNLSIHRDFSHVEDVIRAYRALLRQGKAGEIYNLASGHSLSLSAVLAKMAAQSGRKVTYHQSPERFRPGSEAPIQVDLNRITADTGWSVEYGLDRLLQDLLEEWMK